MNEQRRSLLQKCLAVFGLGVLGGTAPSGVKSKEVDPRLAEMEKIPVWYPTSVMRFLHDWRGVGMFQQEWICSIPRDLSTREWRDIPMVQEAGKRHSGVICSGVCDCLPNGDPIE